LPRLARSSSSVSFTLRYDAVPNPRLLKALPQNPVAVSADIPHAAQESIALRIDDRLFSQSASGCFCYDRSDRVRAETPDLPVQSLLPSDPVRARLVCRSYGREGSCRVARDSPKRL